MRVSAFIKSRAAFVWYYDVRQVKELSTRTKRTTHGHKTEIIVDEESTWKWAHKSRVSYLLKVGGVVGAPDGSIFIRWLDKDQLIYRIENTSNAHAALVMRHVAVYASRWLKPVRRRVLNSTLAFGHGNVGGLVHANP